MFFSWPVKAEAEEATERYVSLLNDTDFEELAKLIAEDAVLMEPGLAEIVGKTGNSVIRSRFIIIQPAISTEDYYRGIDLNFAN